MPLSERLSAMREAVRAGAHHHYRHDDTPDIAAEAAARGLTWAQRAALRTVRMCAGEPPIIEPDQRIVFTRTQRRVPPLYTPDDWAAFRATLDGDPSGEINNICADWGAVLDQGLLARRAQALATRARLAADPAAVEFLEAAVATIDSVLDLAARYAAEARRLGRNDLAAALDEAPANRPTSFHAALQALRLLQAVVWLSGHMHVGLGRLDQYLWPYLAADLAAGRLDWPGAEELLAEFFISLNRDSDLYPGVQVGDNGQSVMLGGVDRAGREAVNPLTWAALRVAGAVAMIDPKINLRVTPDTDHELLREASRLTRLGLGFPQYANDDQVIPGLVAFGYDWEDARDYTVAACWEFIIPGRGMEIVNVGAVSFPAAADAAIRAGLAAGDAGFQSILDRCEAEIRAQVHALIEPERRLILPPAPYFSVLMDGPLATGRDLSAGLKYNNFGLHGAGCAAGADALQAIHELVYDQRTLAPGDLLAALDADFEGYESLRTRLRETVTKVGNNDDDADAQLVWLFERFAAACAAEGDNGRGGRIRPGTGTAMFYVWLARGRAGLREPVVGATADGRHVGDLFGANLAPTPGVTVRGPLSTLQTFAKIPYDQIVNGGPVTLELADNVFRGDEALDKVALLVRAFAQVGCQQMQINTVNLATLEDAQRHPEQHRHLIVRVWGWSGYFVELDPVYQEHVMSRHRHGL